MIANMSPENGATMTFFPVDSATLDYLRLTGRPPELVELVERYYRAQRLFRTSDAPEPIFSSTVELDLGSVQPSLAGPRRPQDRLPLPRVKQAFAEALAKPKNEGGFGVDPAQVNQSVPVQLNGKSSEIKHGAVVVAAITSCTNTSNPTVMLGAGLLAKKAVEKGLKVPAHVKTSLAPGSRVVSEMLKTAGVSEALNQLGFHLVGYGCTTCIGNTGPLAEPVRRAIEAHHLVAAAVLSGNRNFEGRISPHAQANYLASPPLVVAYALAGRVDLDLVNEPLGTGSDGQPVYLRDIWPSSTEVQAAVNQHVRANLFAGSYASVFDGNPTWDSIQVEGGLVYKWQESSTYLQEPPFFEVDPTLFGSAIRNARALAVFGDSVTTDHISPAGDISPNGAAGKYLLERGVPVDEFNSFGARRGNDRVMARGTFGNIRIKNRMLPGVEGSFTLHLPDKTQMSIYEAATTYKNEDTPLIILAGKEYGTGSSRDWAAKGPLLLGVRAVIAESFERIHRSNLAGMGVLPLQFLPGQNAANLGLTGLEIFEIPSLPGDFAPRGEITIQSRNEDGSTRAFQVCVRLDTPSEVRFFRNGGLLNDVLIRLARS
jgi:aconitate hydratase